MALGSDADVAELATGLLDLTDLTGNGADDTTDDAVAELCDRARRAGVAAVCVWPAYVELCSGALAGSSVQVATVVNFPTGDEPLHAVLDQTRVALAAGADEIDVVLPYDTWLGGDVDHAADVLDGVNELVLEPAGGRTGAALMKVIIESGELPDRAAVDRAAHFAINHGARFVKTSTGKTAVSATLEAAETILEAIAVSGEPVGFKASGGIRTLGDARRYLELAERIMGPGWLSPETFRFGASGLLDELEAARPR
jgi:deoxyribose-phosphate aldolase